MKDDKAMPLRFSGKSIVLSLDDIDTLYPVTHALSTELRLRIMRLVVDQAKSVGEIARMLDVPASTVALNVQVLEAAGLVATENQPGMRGTLKLVSRRIDNVSVRLTLTDNRSSAFIVNELPVGAYSSAEGIQPTCGLASHDECFHMDDMPSAFWQPFRLKADLLWMREGALEYRFPGVKYPGRLTALELSFEACSEATGYREDWPSDIAVAINQTEIGVWRSPGDMGSHRGRLNPDWWLDACTQYGLLTTWRVDAYGTALENHRVSRVSIRDLKLDANPYVSVRISVKKIDDHAGGLNLFGRGFGDHPQGIVLKYFYGSDDSIVE